MLLTRRSFLGWTAKLGIVAVSTKIVPVKSLKIIPCNLTASDVVRLEKQAEQEFLIRKTLWSNRLAEILYDEFNEKYKFLREDEWK